LSDSNTMTGHVLHIKERNRHRQYYRKTVSIQESRQQVFLGSGSTN